MQLKAKIRNISGSDSKVAMTMIRIFFMERFLERVSISAYKNQFVLKGGMLVASLIGLNSRATMDVERVTSIHQHKGNGLKSYFLEIARYMKKVYELYFCRFYALNLLTIIVLLLLNYICFGFVMWYYFESLRRLKNSAILHIRVYDK